MEELASQRHVVEQRCPEFVGGCDSVFRRGVVELLPPGGETVGDVLGGGNEGQGFTDSAVELLGVLLVDGSPRDDEVRVVAGVACACSVG
jgi:hypothetical protein